MAFLFEPCLCTLKGAVEQGFYLDFWSFEFTFLPVDIWVELPEPGVAKEHAVATQIGDKESSSFFLVPLSDK